VPPVRVFPEVLQSFLGKIYKIFIKLCKPFLEILKDWYQDLFY